MSKFTIGKFEDSNYTSLRGYVKLKYDDIVEKLGKPLFGPNDPGDKVSCQWIIKFGNDVATIYDWKEYRSLDLEEGVDFHIGGHSHQVTKRGYQEILDELQK